MKRDGLRNGMGLFAALALAFLTGFAVYRIFNFTYNLADDIIMRDIASGAFTGTPDGHLIFIQYVFGFLLSRLYMLNRSIDWYGFAIVGALFLGVAAILYRGFTAEKKLKWKVVYGGIVLCFFVIVLQWHVVWFEWTVSAAVAGGAALYLYATSMTDKRSVKIMDGVFIWLLLIVTMCIRKHIFYMVVPGFGLFFLWRFFKRDGKKIRPIFHELILPGAVFLSVGVIALTENLVYSGEDWKEYEDFNLLRSQVYDYSDTLMYETNPTYFDTMGLDEHDVRNLRHGAFYFVEGLDTEMMQLLSWEREIEKRGSESPKERLWAGISLSAREIVNPAFFWISIPLLLLLCGTVFLAFVYKKELLFPLFLFLIMEGALWFMLGIRGRLPERVSYSLYFVSFMGVVAILYQLIFTVEKKIGMEKRRERRILLTGILGICLCTAVIRGKIDYRDRCAERTGYQYFKDACKDDTDRIYFIENILADAVGGDMVTTHGDFRLNRCLTLGDWYSFSPIDKERFAVYGIENVEEAVLTDPRVYLVVPVVETPGFYGSYFTHKYPDAKVLLKECKVVNGRNYYLYQVRRRGEE